MRVQIFSDIHSDLAALEKNTSAEADLYICAGDLVNWAHGFEPCAEILKPLGEKLWMIPGNHETDRQIASFCEKYGFNSLHGVSFEAGGRHFAGLGHSNVTPFNTPGEYTEEELTDKLAPFAALKPLVLVCHAPPKDTPLDEAGTGMHFGSPAIGRFIETNQPEHFFCGHIHEAAGRRTELGATQAMNVGKAGWLLEL